MVKEFLKDIYYFYSNLLPIPESIIDKIEGNSAVFYFEICPIYPTTKNENKKFLLNTTVGYIEDHERYYYQGTDSNYRFYISFYNPDEILQKYFKIHKARSLFAQDECRIYYTGNNSLDVVRNIKSDLKKLENYLLENNLKIIFLK